MRKILLLICLPALFLVTACKKSYDVGQTAIPKTSNGWWGVITDGVGSSGHVFFSTYSTASNSADSMWVDDRLHLYGFKVKAHLDYKGMTFSSTNALNDYDDGSGNFAATVSITGGKVLPKAGHSRAGNVTDSIYFKAVFSDDPTTTYTITGTARTGLIEDDY